MFLNYLWCKFALGGRRTAVRMFAALAGAGISGLCSCCGGIRPPPDQLVDSGMSPCSLHVGDTIHFTAQTEQRGYPPADVSAVIRSGRFIKTELKYPLHDDGLNGDVKAHDGQWVLDLVWTPKMPRGAGVNAQIVMHFKDDAYPDGVGHVTGLVIEPKE
jgi:hypothetical protein